MSKAPETPSPGGQFLVYQTQDGKLKIDLRFEGETVWLTQQHMAELFQTTQQNISLHLQSIYEESELQHGATHKESLLVRQEGTRSGRRRVDLYNLDAILSVGYRVKSAVATRFRIWAMSAPTLEKIFGLIPRFKSKDELLEEEFSKFVADRVPDSPSAIPAIKTYFKAYVTSDQVRHIIDSKDFKVLATHPMFSTREFKAVPAKYRVLVPEYVKDYVSLNQFVA